VEFEVDVKGRVVSALVKHSSDRAFEEPTLRAVLKWRFEPGLLQGSPVPFRMVIPVNFKLGAE
jgi:protein TonB